METGAAVWFRATTGTFAGTWLSSVVETKEVTDDGKLRIVIMTENANETHSFM